MVHQLAEQSRTIYEEQAWDYDDIMEKIYLLEAEAYYNSGQIKQAHQHLDHILSFSDHTPIAAEYKKSWKNPGSSPDFSNIKKVDPIRLIYNVCAIYE